MTTDARSRSTWRNAPATRVFGSFFSWFSLALALTLLFLAVSALADLGGFCARGGPYVIAVECSDAIVAFTPTSILGGLVTVFLGAALAQGFGVAVLLFAWPALFVSLAVIFLQAFFASGDLTGLFIGILFIAMGLAPLVVALPAAPQRMLLGRVDAQGRAFSETRPARSAVLPLRPPAEPGENPPTIGDWVLSFAVAITGLVLGLWLGVIWFASVA